MKLVTTLLGLAGAGVLALGARALFGAAQGGSAVGGTDLAGTAPPELPAVPHAAPIELISARAFTLERPAVHWYRAEQPSFTSGVVLVLHADPMLLVPRQSFESVLYVGSETAQRVNHGSNSGNLVVVVPFLTLDELRDAPIFFGSPELPERVTAAAARAELATARAAGARAPGARVSQVTEAPFFVLDDDDLRAAASTLVERFAPDERELAEGLRAPRLDVR